MQNDSESDSNSDTEVFTQQIAIQSPTLISTMIGKKDMESNVESVLKCAQYPLGIGV